MWGRLASVALLENAEEDDLRMTKARILSRTAGSRTISLAAASLLLFLAGRLACAQQKALTQYVQTVLTANNGLPENAVNDVAQTTDGYLWFATEEGLARYDGVRVTVFNTTRYGSLRDNYIETLAPSQDGSLWVGTRSGVALLRNGVFRTVMTAKAPINKVFEDHRGVLWVGSLDGLYRMERDITRRYDTRDGLPSANVQSIRESQDGTLWLGTDHGLASLRDGVLRAYGFREGLSSQPISDMAPSRDGSLWIATSEGLVRWRSETGRVEETQPLPQHAWITSLMEDRTGALWIGFDHQGIAVLREGKLVRFGHHQGLPSNDVSRILEDREGNIWVGLTPGGSLELRDGMFVTLGTPEGLSEDMVWSVLQARDGSLWVGTNTTGLDHIDPGGHVHVYTAHDGLPAGSVFALLQAEDGTLWVGGEHGELAHLVNGHFTIVHDPGSQGARVSVLLQDRNGDLLVGFHEMSGIVRFHQGRFGQHYAVPGLVNTAALAPDGSIWVGTDHGGVSRIHDGQITTYTMQSGLLSNFAQAVYVDSDGIVWAGTSPGGLNRIENGRVTTYSVDQGLFDLTVGAIVEDGSGNLWMTCNRGIYRVAKRELTDYASGRIARIHSTVFGIADGMRAAECNFGATPSVWRSKVGTLWFATTAGVASVNPDHQPTQIATPEVLVEAVRLNHRLMPPGPGITAKPGDGDLEITYTAPDFVDPEKIHFRYRLKGFDADWVEAGDLRVAMYTKLPPGRYKLELQDGTDREGWNPETTQLTILLPPHFWQTVWFRSLCVLALLLFAGAVYQMRVRYLLRRTHELEDRVNRRTAELQEAIRQADAAHKALEEQATKDGLTRLWNRNSILEILDREVQRARREQTPLSILMADLDHFKSINDTCGHLAGDDVLQEVARRVSHLIRPYDSAGRYGGEEFLIVLPGCTTMAAVERAEELRRAIELGSISTSQGAIQFTSSFGVAELANGHTASDLIREADAALYAAKRDGRNRIRSLQIA
jgi:diguanylate cyclase (GGDEF)-like protein